MKLHLIKRKVVMIRTIIFFLRLIPSISDSYSVTHIPVQLLIATGDDLQRHRLIVHDVLDLLEVELYFLKPSKCVFEQQQVEYLGLIINGNHILPDPKKLAGLQDWPHELTKVKEVRSILGILGYQRPFIPNFTNIAKPLTNLTKKDVTFRWTPECRTALNTLIAIILNNPLLKQPDRTKPFTLQVETSAFATGAILTQLDSRGKPCAISFHSKTFSNTERNYDIHDRELLAVIHGLEAWRHLLADSAHPVTVLTNHKNLEYYSTPQHVNRHVARYIPRLADYNYKLTHFPGTANKADPLSWRLDLHPGDGDNTDILVLPLSLFANAITLSSLDERVCGHQFKHAMTLSQ
jgi:hypothetical protein